MKPELQAIHSVTSSILDQLNDCTSRDLPPIFSFEGLVGSGKSTQVSLVSELLINDNKVPYIVGIPNRSAIGKLLMLSSIYEEQLDLSKLELWLYPFLACVDLSISLNRAKNESYSCILMSRGLISTYYYYFERYRNLCLDDDIWSNIDYILKGFIKPDVIFYLNINPHVSYQRVKKRNRKPLRKRDQLPNIIRDNLMLESLVTRIKDCIEIQRIDANGSPNDISRIIKDRIDLKL